MVCLLRENTFTGQQDTKKDITITKALFNLLSLLQNCTAMFIIISSVHFSELCSECCRISTGVVKLSYFCILNGLGEQLTRNNNNEISQFIVHIIHTTQSFIAVHKSTCLGITKEVAFMKK